MIKKKPVSWVEIRQLWESGTTRAEISEIYNVNPGTLNNHITQWKKIQEKELQDFKAEAERLQKEEVKKKN